jgi:hypothetical protein
MDFVSTHHKGILMCALYHPSVEQTKLAIAQFTLVMGFPCSLFSCLPVASASLLSSFSSSFKY